MTPIEKMKLLASHGFKQVRGEWVKQSSTHPGYTFRIVVTEGEDTAFLLDPHGREVDSLPVDYDQF